MNVATLLYLIDLVRNLDAVISFFTFLFLISFITIAVCAFGTYGSHNEENHDLCMLYLKRIGKYWHLIALLFLINIAIPTKNTMYLMLGSSYLSNSNLPVKVQQAIELKLDDVITKLKKDKND